MIMIKMTDPKGLRREKLRGLEEYQTRLGKGCSDQIFALKNFFKQCIEWNATRFVNFVDISKASIVSIEILSWT